MPKTNYLRDEYEESLNALSHAVAVGLFLAGSAALLIKSSEVGSAAFSSCIVYCISQTLTYICSSVYHSRVNPVTKKNWRMIDHLSIYLAISGSWTPIFMLGLDFYPGILLTCAVWSMCGWGMIYKIRNLGKNEIVSVILYLAMGWSGIISFLITDNPVLIEAFDLIFIGGVLYTVGTFFYYRDFNKYFHTIWHLFTIAAAVIHYCAIWSMLS